MLTAYISGPGFDPRHLHQKNFHYKRARFFAKIQLSLFNQNTMDFRKYSAELVGTFMLTLAVSLSLLVGMPLATPVIAGLTLGLGVYILGPISGAHFNPAVTFALASIKKIEIRDAVMYVIFQIIGAVLAMLLAHLIVGESLTVIAQDAPLVGIVEALGAAVLVLGVLSVVYGKVDDDVSGLVIGGSLTLGLLLTAGRSNAVINPAVAIGLGSISFMYLVAPIVGGIIAAYGYKYLLKK
jgi:glycerol uptake facilitator-like aquaporin